eukprot:FR739188.1.p1 GENE.FR739188.1~~FR739188.1.p1  ORF type:complete len:149 (+),score=13.51 FR739188.1:35-448(+)
MALKAEKTQQEQEKLRKQRLEDAKSNLEDRKRSIIESRQTREQKAEAIHLGKLKAPTRHPPVHPSKSTGTSDDLLPRHTNALMLHRKRCFIRTCGEKIRSKMSKECVEWKNSIACRHSRRSKNMTTVLSESNMRRPM